MKGRILLGLLLGATAVASARALDDGEYRPRITALEAHPERIELTSRFAYAQLLVSGRTEDGEVLDVTRMVELDAPTPSLHVDEHGLVRPLLDGEGELRLRLGELAIAIPYRVSGTQADYSPEFITDVMPVISRAGCNAGSCHGSASGKNGFKLSLRGYDPAFDHVALTDDLAARRFDRSQPAESLFLLKPTASVPHQGGLRLRPGTPDYETLYLWAENGARFDADAPRVASIRILPERTTIPRPGMSQQVAVLATYTDGSVRDVTLHAFVETSSTEVTKVEEGGLVTGLRRGEAAILARYEGHYAAAPLFVMGDRSGWEWVETPEYNFIDTLVYAKLRAVRSLPSELCTDAEFVRRVYLDLTGIPPTSRETRLFLMDTRPGREKREELIDRLIGSADFVDYWTNKWCDLLQVSSRYLGEEGAEIFRGWIRKSVASDEPYDRFVRELLTSSGSTYENPPAAYYKITREPDVVMENTTQLFLGVRFACNKCHDHPFERWTQRDHWQLAAYFAGVKRENVDGSPMLAGGVAREERISDGAEGEVRYPNKNEVARPAFPFEHAGHDEAGPAEGTLRQELADWLTAPENQYFARSFVNRVWSYFTGVGLIDPVDDIRAGNPPTNPELLDRLEHEFIAGGFDVRALMRTICRSRVYQQSVRTNEWNEGDEVNFSHALARRLPAEVLYDAVHRATGTRSGLPGVRADTRAVQLLDASVKSPDGFLDLFGRPPRESACECERNNGMSLGQALNLVNGPTVADAVRADDGGIADLVAVVHDPRELVEELYLSFLCRFPTADELDALAPTLSPTDPANRAALGPEDAAELKERRAAWEQEHLPIPEWRPLVPVLAVSAGGAQAAVDPDGTVRFEGERPEKDAYTLVFPVPETPITGLRLEALADEALPGGGPGRADNGNFVLNGLEVSAVPLGDPGAAHRVELANASADFSQGDYAVAGAIDGKPETGWAVSPRFGVSHVAVFETKEDVGDEGGTLIAITLSQRFGTWHTLGRLRISATSSPRPVRHHGLPEPVALALAVPAEQRSAEEEAALHAYFIGTQPDLAARIRLSATQDLAWALANSPAFLFNR